MTARFAFDNRDLARIAVFAALIAVLGMVPPIAVPFIPVPITAQTLGVMLAGLVLGGVRGAASVIVLLVLAAIGLPVLAGGNGGLGAFVGPTAGYLYGWIPGAFVAGLVAHAGGRITWWKSAAGAVLGGILVVYLVGIPVQVLVTGLPFGASIVASAAFLPGDLVKAAIAVVVVSGLWRAYPAAFPARMQTAAPVRATTPGATAARV